VSILNLARFDATPLQTEPCDYVIVPEFVKPEALAGLNADFPAIDAAGNFPFEDLTCGPRFQALVNEMTGPEVRRHFAAKFGMDLDPFPIQVAIRKHMSILDGHIHNDSRSKKITVLIYFNEQWTQPGGQLRLNKGIDKMDDYYVEVPPVRGNLIAFRRNKYSFHGFPPASGERRALQMYWIDPQRFEKKKATGVRKIIHKLVRRTMKKF
jgi:SM-20-related protein